MKVVLVNQTKVKTPEIREKRLQAVCDTILTYLQTRRVRNQKWLTQKAEISIVLLTEREMKKINKHFRGKDKATDILSFESADATSLGELLICFDVIKAQARRHGHPVADELLYMLIHGILHLLGYDHEASAAEEKRMLGLQDKCFDSSRRFLPKN